MYVKWKEKLLNDTYTKEFRELLVGLSKDRVVKIVKINTDIWRNDYERKYWFYLDAHHGYLSDREIEKFYLTRLEKI